MGISELGGRLGFGHVEFRRYLFKICFHYFKRISENIGYNFKEHS